MWAVFERVLGSEGRVGSMPNMASTAFLTPAELSSLQSTVEDVMARLARDAAAREATGGKSGDPVAAELRDVERNLRAGVRRLDGLIRKLR